MAGGDRPRVLSEARGRWLLNLFPPLLLGRVRVLEIAPGYRAIRVRVTPSWLTRNLHGTIFGGTIFSAADPFHAVMYWQALARRGLSVEVWLKSATIRYRRPAALPLALDFRLTDDELETAAAALSAGRDLTRVHRVEARDTRGQLCAEIDTEVHLRIRGPAPEF